MLGHSSDAFLVGHAIGCVLDPLERNDLAGWRGLTHCSIYSGAWPVRAQCLRRRIFNSIRTPIGSQQLQLGQERCYMAAFRSAVDHETDRFWTLCSRRICFSVKEYIAAKCQTYQNTMQFHLSTGTTRPMQKTKGAAEQWSYMATRAREKQRRVSYLRK